MASAMTKPTTHADIFLIVSMLPPWYHLGTGREGRAPPSPRTLAVLPYLPKMLCLLLGIGLGGLFHGPADAVGDHRMAYLATTELRPTCTSR